MMHVWSCVNKWGPSCKSPRIRLRNLDPLILLWLRNLPRF